MFRFGKKMQYKLLFAKHQDISKYQDPDPVGSGIFWVTADPDPDPKKWTGSATLV